MYARSAAASVTKRSDIFFESEHLSGGLRGRSVRGVAIAMLSQAGRLLIQLASMAALARLMSPMDFGIFGKTIALTGFVTVIQAGGLSLATIQSGAINRAQVSNLFWINVVFGLGAASLVVAVSPLLAWFYGDPRVFLLGASLAGPVILSSVATQHAALMQRQMRFAENAVVSLLALIAGFSAAIVCAARGLGFWSLVVQQYVTALVAVVLLVAYCPWIPNFPRRGSGVRPMVRIGASQSGFNIVNFASRNLDYVLIGRFVSDTALGFYTLSYRLLLLPVQQINGPISAVVLPALCRLRTDPERYARFYYRALEAIVFFGMPIVAFLVVDARPVIVLVLGTKWLPSASIFQALGVAAFIGTFNVAGSWVCNSQGCTEKLLRWQLFATAATAVAFLVGIKWGAYGVAASFSAVEALLFGPALLYFFRGTQIQLRTALMTLARPAAAAIAAASVLWCAHVIGTMRTSQGFCFDALFYVVAYLAGWTAMPDGRAHMRGLVTLASELRPRRCEV